MYVGLPVLAHLSTRPHGATTTLTNCFFRRMCSASKHFSIASLFKSTVNFFYLYGCEEDLQKTEYHRCYEWWRLAVCERGRQDGCLGCSGLVPIMRNAVFLRP